MLIAVVSATSIYSPRLFHTLAEASFVAVAYAAFVMAWNLRRFSDDDFFLVVSRALLVVGLLRLLHALTYPGVHIVEGGNADLAIKFSLAAGFLAGVALLCAPLALGRRPAPRISMWMFWVTGALLVLVVCWPRLLPAAYAADGTMTGFASAVALASGAMLVGSAGSLLLRRHLLSHNVLRFMIVAVVALAAFQAGLIMPERLGSAQEVGRHLLLVISALSIYQAVVQSGLARPMTLAVEDLERRRHAANRRYRVLVDQSPMGVFILDGNGVIQAANTGAAEILGAPPEELVTRSFRDLRDQRAVPCIEQALAGSPSCYEGPHRSRFRDAELWVAVRAAPLADDDGRQAGCIVAVMDLTQGKRAEELVERLTFRDALTGLANRTLLQDRLSQALLTAARLSRRVTVVAVNLDRFKHVNDTLGRAVGDQLLQAAAARFESLLRSDDTAARTSGDEFMLVLPGVGTVEDAVTVTERIAEAMREVWNIDSHVFHTTASLGAAVYPEDGLEADPLIEHAHAAMRLAKREGGGTCQYFSASINVQAEDRLAMESDLHRALSGDQEFQVYYQPQVSLVDGRLVGLEALVRWQHPTRGTLAPDLFVPLAETIGLIGEIDRLVLFKACEVVAAIHRTHDPGIRLAVNMSARVFRRGDIAETVALALQTSGLAPELLELEVTETAAMTDVPLASRAMSALHATGVTLALDDFGTGFSSLAHIRELPIDRIKIDRSFVNAITDDASTRAIVAGVIGLAQSLGISVLAEGVETSAQADALRELGCQEAQGYLYARPMCASKLDRYLIYAAEARAET